MTTEERPFKKRNERLHYPTIKKIDWAKDYRPDGIQVYFRGLFCPVPKIFVYGDYNESDFIETQLIESESGEVVHKALDGSIVRLLKRWENKQFDGEVATFSRLKIIYGEREKTYRLKATWYQRTSDASFSIVCAIESEPFAIRSTKRFISDVEKLGLADRELKKIKLETPTGEIIQKPKRKKLNVDDDDFEVDDDDDSADSTYNPSPALKKSIVPKPPIQLPSPCSLLNRTVTLPPINSVLKSNTHPIALARYPSFLTVEQKPKISRISWIT